jgi:hypothetical protein
VQEEVEVKYYEMIDPQKLTSSLVFKVSPGMSSVSRIYTKCGAGGESLKIAQMRSREQLMMLMKVLPDQMVVSHER